MKRRTVRKIRAGLKAILAVLDKESEWMLFPSRREVYRQFYRPQYASFEEELWKEYYASSIRDGVERLLRQGNVEVKQTPEGTRVRITHRGKTEVIQYRLESLAIAKQEKWDGKWRMVFFDVNESDRSKRDRLRKWLVRLGLKRMQKSVFVYPYPLEKELKFLREVLEVPHLVKLVTAQQIENDNDLREWFDLSPFAKNRERELGDASEEISLRRDFAPDEATGRRYPGRKPAGAS